MYSEKFLKNSIKLLRSPFPVADLFYSKSTQRVLRDSSHSDTRALETLWHSKSTWTLGYSRHLCTWSLEALGHLGTNTTEIASKRVPFYMLNLREANC